MKWHHNYVTYSYFVERNLSPDNKEKASEILQNISSWRTENIRNRERFEYHLIRLYRDGLEAMDDFYFSSIEAFDWGMSVIFEEEPESSSDEETQLYYQVISGLVARALTAYAEVICLLRSGFPGGAFERARFMQEVYVTAMTIARYGHPLGEHPELVERYLRHRDVFEKSFAEELMNTNILGDKHPFSKEIFEALEKNQKDTKEMIGKSAGGMWAWASPVLPEGETPTMKSISEKVLPNFYFFYKLGSRHAHAGSEGWPLGHIEVGDQDGLIVGSQDNDLGLPATLATAFMTDLMTLVVPVEVESEDGIDTKGKLIHEILENLSEIIRENMFLDE